MALRRLCTPFIRRYVKGRIPEPNGKAETFKQKAVRVSVLGADTPTGEATCLMLKQNPLVSQIYLHGSSKALGVAADLKHLDTRCRVHAYHGGEGLPNAIRSADIVLILGLDVLPPEASVEDRLRSEGYRIIELAEACSRYAPKSLITVCAAPVSCTLPLVAAIFRRTHWYHPGRIIGSVALAQIRANSLTARHQDLDPTCVHVPLLGGPDTDCVVPLFSRSIPQGVTPEEGALLSTRMKGIAEDESPIVTTCPCKLRESPLSEAFAINRMVTTMGLGLCGDHQAICTAFIRSDIINTCRHLVCTVQFGPGGVVHNFGVPRLTSFELKLLERSTLLLDRREQMALDFLRTTESPHSTVTKMKIEGNPTARSAQLKLRSVSKN